MTEITHNTWTSVLPHHCQGTQKPLQNKFINQDNKTQLWGAMEPFEMSAWDCGESVQDKQHAKKKNQRKGFGNKREWVKSSV